DTSDSCQLLPIESTNLANSGSFALRIALFPAPLTMGATCLKSPAPINGFLPNGSSVQQICLRRRSTLSSIALFAIGSIRNNEWAVRPPSYNNAANAVVPH
ncbi:27128_t:CDS:2, partial [Racocetra persica]